MLSSLLRMLFTRSLKPFQFTDQYEPKLPFEQLEHLGLYIHIPFCRSLCSFCPYCKVLYDASQAHRYKNALLREFELVCDGMAHKKKATSLYFGGGTPALLIDHLGELIEQAKRYFDITGEIGVELHPDDVRTDVLQKLRQAGVSMASLGVQSFDEHCLRRLGRGDGESMAEKLRMLRDAGFAVVDVDLIFGITGQTEESLRKDMETAFANGATQVSTYPFIQFSFADQRAKPVPHPRQNSMLSLLSRVGEGLGVERTAVWTFAKKQTERYSSVTRDTFLGFGASATTLLADSFKLNTFSVDAYCDRVESGLLPTSLTLHFSKRQRAAYFLFWSAYSLQIDPTRFEQLLGSPLFSLCGFEMRAAALLGLVRRESDGMYRLAEKATRLYHRIEQQITHAYIDKVWSISRETPFPEQIRLY